jgi:DNA replication and repair protein RecF
LYHRLDLELEPIGLALHGPNASGKSTLVEAITMLSTTRASRADSDRELINWQSGEDFGLPPYARARGTAERIDGEREIDIALQVDPSGTRPIQKAIRLNGRPVRATDAVGVLKSVSFSPEDVALIAGSPSGRRRHLDILISQIDPAYMRALGRFNKILEQRNSLLKSLGRENGPSAANQLSYWDEQLVAYGSVVTAKRIQTTEQLNRFGAARFHKFGDTRTLSLSYLPSLADQTLSHGKANSGADLGALVSRVYTERVSENRREELARGITITGPHRDDFSMAIDEMNVATFGSRGQQRLAVVALKLAETDVITNSCGEAPVILLDDVLSELDPVRQTGLTDAVAELHTQVIVTTTDPETISRTALRSLPRAEIVRPGTIALASKA